MTKRSMFSIAHLSAHTECIVAAVSQSGEAVIISDNGAPRAVLQCIDSFNSLQDAVGLLERTFAQHTDSLAGNRRRSVLFSIG